MNLDLIHEFDMSHPAWPHFVESMKGRRYGAEETLDAWQWFWLGWQSHYIKPCWDGACYRGVTRIPDGGDGYLVFCETCYPLMYRENSRRLLNY